MHLSAANSEYTVQEENLLSRFDTGGKRTKFTSTEEVSSIVGTMLPAA